MENIKKYDAIIIGSGQSGNHLMHDLTKKGQSVAIVEKSEMGGSCINVGCTPTKTLIASSNLFDRMKKSDELGIYADDIKYLNAQFFR